MEAKREGDTILVRLEKGEKVNESLAELAERKGLGFCSVSGIGSLEKTTLAYLGEEGLFKNEFPGRREFMCVGNLSLKEGKQSPHIHAWLGDREKKTASGHLVEGTVAVTCELVLKEFGKTVKRKLDPATDYLVLDLA